MNGPERSSAAPRTSGEVVRDSSEEAIRENLHRRVENDFRYHPPKEGQAQVYTELRAKARAFAHYLVDTVPPGRELSRALSDLEDVVMHANSGIARNG